MQTVTRRLLETRRLLKDLRQTQYQSSNFGASLDVYYGMLQL